MLKRSQAALYLFAVLASPCRAGQTDDIKPVGKPRAVASLKGCILPFYRWMTRDEVLVFEGEKEKLKATGLSISRIGKSAREPVPGFREMWSEIQREGFPGQDEHIGVAHVSPDGSNLLFKSAPSAPGSDMLTWEIMNFREKNRSRPRGLYGGFGDPLWTPDSKRLVVLTGRNLEVFDVGKNSIRPEQTHSLPAGIPDSLKGPSGDGGDTRFREAWVGKSGAVYWLSNPYGWNWKSCELVELGHFEKPELARRRMVRVPPCRFVAAVELSPDEKQLAWLTVPRERKAELWVTDLDGGNARQLVKGIEPPTVWVPDAYTDPKNPNGKGLPYVAASPHRIQLAWRPGTTAVSYNSEDRLWVVETEPK